jgi:hypothetical protein
MMPLIVENMSLGQLRLERKRVQGLWWQYVELYKASELLEAAAHPSCIGKAKRHFLQLMAVGAYLDMLNEELDRRNYEYALKSKCRPET